MKLRNVQLYPSIYFLLIYCKKKSLRCVIILLFRHTRGTIGSDLFVDFSRQRYV